MDEPKKQPLPVQSKTRPDREVMGYQGKVGAVETAIYQDGRDSTGTFTEVVMRSTEQYTRDGRLEEKSDLQVEQDLTHGVLHYYFDGELEKSIVTRGYSATLRVEYERDLERRIVKEIASQSNTSEIEYTCTRRYDARGNRLSRICVNPGGGSMGREDCAYDAQGRLASRLRKRGEADHFVPGTILDWYEGLLSLDGEGVVSRESFEYGASGEYVLRREWVLEDTLFQTHHLTFRNEKLIQSLVVEGNGDSVGTQTYAYDEKGNVASMQLDFEPAMGGWKWTDEFRYEYDIQGNWTSRELFHVQGGQPGSRWGKVVRNVSYY